MYDDVTLCMMMWHHHQRFLFELLCIPRLKSRLQCFVFILEFNARLHDLSENVEVVSYALHDIKRQEILKSPEYSDVYTVNVRVRTFENFWELYQALQHADMIEVLEWYMRIRSDINAV